MATRQEQIRAQILKQQQAAGTGVAAIPQQDNFIQDQMAYQNQQNAPRPSNSPGNSQQAIAQYKASRAGYEQQRPLGEYSLRNSQLDAPVAPPVAPQPPINQVATPTAPDPNNADNRAHVMWEGPGNPTWEAKQRQNNWSEVGGSGWLEANQPNELINMVTDSERAFDPSQGTTPYHQQMMQQRNNQQPSTRTMGQADPWNPQLGGYESQVGPVDPAVAAQVKQMPGQWGDAMLGQGGGRTPVNPNAQYDQFMQQQGGGKGGMSNGQGDFGGMANQPNPSNPTMWAGGSPGFYNGNPNGNTNYTPPSQYGGGNSMGGQQQQPSGKGG